MSRVPKRGSSGVQTKSERFLICYSGITGRHSRRWHRFLRTCGTRVIAGLYELENMTPRLSRRLYQEALEATHEGGAVNVYPICKSCDRRGWRVGPGQSARQLDQVDYFIV